MIAPSSPPQIRSELEQERDRLRAAIEAVNHTGSLRDETGDLSIGSDDHIADSASETYMRELDGGLEENAEHLLVEIDAALARIDEGSYGRCVVCGRPIGAERLEAVPYALRAHEVDVVDPAAIPPASITTATYIPKSYDDLYPGIQTFMDTLATSSGGRLTSDMYNAGTLLGAPVEQFRHHLPRQALAAAPGVDVHVVDAEPVAVEGGAAAGPGDRPAVADGRDGVAVVRHHRGGPVDTP